MKIKFKKKFFLGLLLLISFVGLFVSIISLKIINSYKPAFYSYSSYADKKTMNDIDKKYSYKEYGDFNEFEYAIENNKAIAGIASDYSIMNMVVNGTLAPISREIKKIIMENKNVQDKEYLNYFTEETRDQMLFFDKILGKNAEVQKMLNEKYKDEYGENYTYKFSDFVVPYFINDRVFAFDTKKLFNQTNTSQNPLEFEDLKFNPPSVTEFLKKIFEQTTKQKIKIQWVKNEIENTVFGSEYNNEEFITEIDETNCIKLLDNFNQIIKDGTGSYMNNHSVNIFEPDSDVTLNNLVNPLSKINVAVLYNGDALDAYYGNDNFQNVEDGENIRIVRTKNNIRILDAFVLSSGVDKKQKKELLRYFNKNLFDGMFYDYEYFEKEKEEIDIYEDIASMRIFDYVNYTPSSLGTFSFIEKNYFLNKDGSIDENALDIFHVSKTDEFRTVLPISPINKQILSNLKIEFQKKIN